MSKHRQAEVNDHYKCYYEHDNQIEFLRTCTVQTQGKRTVQVQEVMAQSE